MIELPVQIRADRHDRPTAIAWLLPGDSPAEWFCEWIRWKTPLHTLQVLPIAGIGVVTLLADETPAPQTLRAIPLRSIGGRVFLPAGSVLTPEMTAEEALALISPRAAAGLFWPGRGLLLPTRRDWLRVADLLLAPTEIAVDWSGTLPGERLNDRLDRIDRLVELEVEQILDDGGDDIGTHDQLTDLPPRPDEPGDRTLDRLRRALQQGVGRVAAGMSRKFGRIAGQAGDAPAGGAGIAGSGLGQLANWAAGLLQKVSRELEELRLREFLRLLQLLRQNPDEGLKYAIEMGGGSHRGVAPPGGRLIPHGVDFQLNRSGGTPSADYWNIPPSYQAQLIQQYRALANRELQLKRFRRAAYIFAHLLGDYSSAAAALRAGRHCREAAIVYRDRLRQPLVAAACFEEGGLLHEAIELYEELGDHEKVGDLHARLEQHDKAREAWQKAIEVAVNRQSDYVRAAEIALNKLTSPDRALALLETGWHCGHSSRECLTRRFAIFARYCRHADATTTLADLRSGSGKQKRDTVAIEVLSEWVGRYPDASVVEMAADTARVLAAIHLRRSTSGEIKRLTDSLARLNPGDQLLARDARRFADRSRPQPARSPVARQTKTSRKEVLAPFLTLSLRINEVTGALFANGSLLATGTVKEEATLAVLTFAHELLETYRLEPRCGATELQFVQDDRGAQPVLLTTFIVRGDDEGVRTGNWVWQPPIPPIPGQPLKPDVGPPLGREFSDPVPLYGALTSTVAICYAQRLVWHLVVRNQELVALGMAPTERIPAPFGTPMRSERICRVDDPHSVRAQGNSELLAIACDSQFRLFSANSTNSLQYVLEEPVAQLALSPAFSERCVAAGMATGAWIMSPGKGMSHPTPLPGVEDWPDTRVCFTRNRQIVVVSPAGGCIFQFGKHGIEQVARLPEFSSPPAAVVSMPALSLFSQAQTQFAVVETNGTVSIFAENCPA